MPRVTKPSNPLLASLRRGPGPVTEASRPGRGTIRLRMAEQEQLSLQEQLEGIGAQLDWVRGYL